MDSDSWGKYLVRLDKRIAWQPIRQRYNNGAGREALLGHVFRETLIADYTGILH